MTLNAGQTLSHYRILEPIGSGAMGQVYRAQDTNLDRSVAVKVLPAEFVDDAERLRRFEREARTLASVNHPNVAQIFGLDRADDTRFIAMEYVQGEDLAARLRRGPLDRDECVAVGLQIAAGLEAAHEAGVVHRDLKPANVLIGDDGRVKLLDFGLAKPFTDALNADTLTTQAGVLLGTPPYMSPEQTRGKDIDRRADIWAFGCVLYECLTGRRAFAAESVSDLLAAIVGADPDWSALPATTPPSVRTLLQRCLRKDPQRRLRDIGDARIALEEFDEAPAPEPPAIPASRVRLTGWVATAVALAATGVGFLTWLGREDTERMDLQLRPVTFAKEWETSPTWSPEGESIAYTGMADGTLDIFVRPLVGVKATALVTGPGDQHSPAWSPDGKWIAFLSSEADGVDVFLARPHGEGDPIRLVETGLPPLELNTSTHCLGTQPWLDHRFLLVSLVLPTGQLALHRVDRETGERKRLTNPKPGEDDVGGSVSAAGDQIVFERRRHGRGTLWTMPAEGGAPVLLLADAFDNFSPAWRADGRRVLFCSFRGSFSNLFEIDIEAPGRPRGVTHLPRRVWGYAVSADDRIAFASIWHDTWLWSVDVNTGEQVVFNEHNGDNFGARFSPDDGVVAYHSNREGHTDVWSIDLQTGKETNLTSHEAIDIYPDWSPDGSQLLFVSNRNGDYNLWTMTPDGTRLQCIVDEPIGVEGSYSLNAALIARWSPTGNRIAYMKAGDRGNELWAVNADGTNRQLLLEEVVGFDWLDERVGLISRASPGQRMALLAVDLENGATRELFRGAHTEIDVAPDGSAVTFCAGTGHIGMKPAVLDLEPPEKPDGLPGPKGEARHLYDLALPWHVHMGGWSADSKRIVFTYDRDYGDVFVLEPQ